MIQPKQSDIKEAREYLRRRLAAEISMEHYLDRRLIAAAREIVEYAYSRNIPPTLFSFQYDPFLAYEVERIIRILISEIEDYDFELADSTNRNEGKTLLPYMTRDIDGFTYHDRLTLYSNRFRDEVEQFIKAGLVAGLTKSALESVITKSYKTPYKNTIISDVEHRGFTAYPRLLLLTRHTIADAWMHADMEYHLRRGAIGFTTYRGSSFPCDTCADYAGRFHTFDEPYPPLHNNCKCYAVPIYKD